MCSARQGSVTAITLAISASASVVPNPPPISLAICSARRGSATATAHATLTITRKSGKVVTIPLAPRTARAIDLAADERCDGPVFLTGDGRRLDGTAPGRSSAGSPGGPGSARTWVRTRCGTRSSSRRWTPGCRCAMCRRPLPANHYEVYQSGSAAVWTGTRPISSLPTSRAPPGNSHQLTEFRLAAVAARRD